MTWVVAPSPGASGGGTDPRLGCSGRILLLIAERGLARGPVSRSRFVEGGGQAGIIDADVQSVGPSHGRRCAANADRREERQTQRVSFRASRLMNQLLEFPFELLEAINDAISDATLFEEKVKAERIRIQHMEGNASCRALTRTVSCRLSRSPMQQPVCDGRVVWSSGAAYRSQGRNETARRTLRAPVGRPGSR
jgi:hypothetical protein